MESRSSLHRSKTSRGITLFEVVIVMAFIAMVGGFSTLVSMDTFHGNIFHTERDLLVASLQHARSQAVGNVCLGASCTTGKPHGVHIEADKFVVFQGATYATRDAMYDAEMPANPVVSHTGSVDIVFAELSGNATPGSISMAHNGRTSVITVSAAGQILWTN